MHYVIVVHGIGEQRKNETVLNVITRFAEANRGLDKGQLSGILTLGKASGQTGQERLARALKRTSSGNIIPPWIEFRGIPQPDLKQTDPEKYNELKNIPFYGEDPIDDVDPLKSEKGKNIRFVDLCWSDIMQDDAKEVTQVVEVWAKGLMGRLNLKDEQAESVQCENARVPPWILKILSTLVDTLTLIRKLMSFRFKEMEELVFTKFLGDVQLYGEFPITRGKAVRRFHRLIARIEEEHKVEMEEKGQPYSDKPTYTIIAHSLGTIMSLDSLFYALVKQDIRTGKNPSETPNLPFPGYFTEKDASKRGDIDYINTRWIERIENFVTLGSPIDKYLVMWWLNYKYLVKPEEWKTSIRTKIKHFNYSDELDPVGHKLDIVEQTPAYDNFFKKEIDVVFNRYSTFGVAHNTYWKDSDLFKAIFSNTVDRQEKTDEVKPSFEKIKRFKLSKYLRLILTTYFLTPLFFYSAATLCFEWLLSPAHSFQSNVIAIALLFFTLLLGNKVIKILILGRQVQRIKAEDEEKEFFEKVIRKCVGWFIKLMIPLLPIALTIYAISGLDWSLVTILGLGTHHPVSLKWFVALTYLCVAFHFFTCKYQLRGTTITINDYESFSNSSPKSKQ